LFDQPQLLGRRSGCQPLFDSLDRQFLELGGVFLPRYLHRPPFHGDGDCDYTSPVEDEISREAQYLQEHDIRFPIPIDNDFSTWNRYGNRYWPAMYLIDKQGVIRHVRIGEGGYQETERLIQSLLAETF
jgi:hypothetical protein